MRASPSKHSTSLRRLSTPSSGRAVSISALHPAYRSGRSIFTSRVFDPDEVQRVLKTGHQSRKIGKAVMKGPRRGWPIFTLTLEERATCPRTCRAWGICYGNNMHAAERIVAGEALEAALWQELADLDAEYPRGFLVRLHVLGDFYSAAYVKLWREALAAFPALHVFGFTAHDPADAGMGEALFDLATRQWERFALRFSGLGGGRFASRIGDGDSEAVPCPAQTGASECCATCMLCVHSQRSILFRRH